MCINHDSEEAAYYASEQAGLTRDTDADTLPTQRKRTVHIPAPMMDKPFVDPFI